MIYITLFLVFLKIGTLAFGGGFSMISFMREACITHGWLSEAEFLNCVALAESTPGPIAINIATYIGSTQAGFWGAVVATLGVVLPAFLVVILIVICLSNFMKSKGVRAFLGGVHPTLAALVLGTGLIMLVGQLNVWTDTPFNWQALCILGILVTISLLWKRLRHKNPSPILLIFLSGVMGILFYGV